MNEFVTDATLKEIGRVVVWSAEVDLVLAGVLDDLVGARRAKLLTAGQNFTWLVQAIKKVVNEAWDQPDRTLDGLLEDASRLHESRDLVVHGVWLPKDIHAYLADEDPTEYHAVRPRRWKETLIGKTLTDDELRALADELMQLSVTLRKWRDDYLPYNESRYARAEWRTGRRQLPASPEPE
ncbi:MAG: hypothetical protein HGA44_01610 [Cellulomonadaceae bacterium]|nr:hypothetical protein [Cellulomonadaceae bacterium]